MIFIRNDKSGNQGQNPKAIVLERGHFTRKMKARFAVTEPCIRFAIDIHLSMTMPLQNLYTD